jgi:hypothetical protein
MLWGVTPDTCKMLFEKGYLQASQYKPDKPQTFVIKYLMSGTVKDIEDGKIQITGYDNNGCVIGKNVVSRKTMPRSQWNYDSHDAMDYGSRIIKDLLCNPRFDFPKSLYAVHDSIRFFIANNPNAIVVDFFAGSGTTGHAVNLLNAEDGGNRRYIMVTNNEISEQEAKAFEAKGINKGDPEWEARGIAKYVTWPRMLCCISGKNILGEPLKGTYLGSDIKLSDGFNTNLKYLKCDWTQRKPDDHLLSNVLMMHIKEMIELQNFIEIDNEKNVLILNKDDVKKYLLDCDKYKNIEEIWINQNIVLNSVEMKLLKQKDFKYVPKEFFGDELKEAAE